MKTHTCHIKWKKPTTPSIRFQLRSINKVSANVVGYDRFTLGANKKSGKNNIGRATVLHRGGGHTVMHTKVDFNNCFRGSAKLVSIKKDPRRTALLGLFLNSSGLLFYRILPYKLRVGQRILITNVLKKHKIRQGSCLPLMCLPKRKIVHGVELSFKQKSSVIRSAGAKATIIKKFKNGFVFVKLKTGEIRFISGLCMASLGQVSNTKHHMQIQGKAGLNKWLNCRPHVRGVAMNPIDHPHGGGQGKSKGGKPAVSPWGKQTKGPRTRTNRTKFIARTKRFKKEKK
jgi:large subunit ribosomal protein L2